MTQRLRNSIKNSYSQSLKCDANLPRILNVNVDKSITTSDRLLRKRSQPKLASASNTKPCNQPLSPQNLRTSRSVCARLPSEDKVIQTAQLQQKKQRTNDDNRQSWEKLLKSKSKSTDDFRATLSGNPLYTLHFVAKELQLRLETLAVRDPHLQQLVLDMREALSKIPKEIISFGQIQKQLKELEQMTGETKNNYQKLLQGRAEQPQEKKNPAPAKPQYSSKTCQAVDPNVLLNSEKIQKTLELSALKLETTCKEMERICNQLKSEKNEVNLMLLSEQNNVKFLQQQVEDLEKQKIGMKMDMCRGFEEQRRDLQAEIASLQAEVRTQQDKLLDELKSLQAEKSKLEEESVTLKHKLAVSSMEKEKYVAMLGVRDHQIHEIRTEMAQLQEVVNDQLKKMQTSSIVYC